MGTLSSFSRRRCSTRKITRSIRKVCRNGFPPSKGTIDYENRDLDITAGNDVTFCHSLNRMMATTAKGEKVDLWFRATLGFRKIAGQWKIVHEHSSVPFYMDGSFKAAVDLKP